MLREWLWRGRRLNGQLRLGVTAGLFFGIWMSAWGYWVAYPGSAVRAGVFGIFSAAWFGTFWAVSRYAGGSDANRELFQLPPSDRVALIRAFRRGEPIPDPRLAPAALAYADALMESVHRQQSPLWRSMPFAFAAVVLVVAVPKTSTGPVWQAVLVWAVIALLLSVGLTMPRSLRRMRRKAEAVADYAAVQIGRSPAD